jgi:hypothetical protein
MYIFLRTRKEDMVAKIKSGCHSFYHVLESIADGIHICIQKRRQMYLDCRQCVTQRFGVSQLIKVMALLHWQLMPLLHS